MKKSKKISIIIVDSLKIITTVLGFLIIGTFIYGSIFSFTTEIYKFMIICSVGGFLIGFLTVTIEVENITKD